MIICMELEPGAAGWTAQTYPLSQQTLTYFETGSITVRLTSCLTWLGFSCFVCVQFTTHLLVWPNPNQSNRRSAVQ